jgi:hypothetical protein
MSGIGTAALTVFIIIVCLIAVYQWWKELNDMQRLLIIGFAIVALIVLIFGP